MTEHPESAEQKLIGRALKALREQAEMTQPQAAEAMGITLTAWQNYEAGRRQWKPELIRRVTTALGATPEDLARARTAIAETGDTKAPPSRLLPDHRAPNWEIPVFGRVRAGPTGPNVYDVGEPESVVNIGAMLGRNARALRLAGESMVPYAEPGGFVVYQIDRWPRRGQGCVVETMDGEYYVKRYDRQDGAAVYVTELHPKPKEIRFELTKIKGIYAIALRGD